MPCAPTCEPAPGYIIPQNVVKHFLEEFEAHGTFRGCCSVGFRWQDMENISLKEHFKVGTSSTVVRDICARVSTFQG